MHGCVHTQLGHVARRSAVRQNVFQTYADQWEQYMRLKAETNDAFATNTKKVIENNPNAEPCNFAILAVSTVHVATTYPQFLAEH